MTDIEKKALALVNEVSDGFHDVTSLYAIHTAKALRSALCRAIEQHEAFRQEVSDVCEGLLACTNANKRYGASLVLNRFIIAKPDPLVEVINDADNMVRKPDAPSYAEAIRAALEARGGRIVWEGE